MSTPTYLPALGRVLIALIFVMSGLGKIAAPANTIAYIQSTGAPLAPVAYAIAVIVEVAGGLALMVGFQTRLTAAALAVCTLATAILFHNNMADQNHSFPEEHRDHRRSSASGRVWRRRVQPRQPSQVRFHSGVNLPYRRRSGDR